MPYEYVKMDGEISLDSNDDRNTRKKTVHAVKNEIQSIFFCLKVKLIDSPKRSIEPAAAEIAINTCHSHVKAKTHR